MTTPAPTKTMDAFKERQAANLAAEAERQAPLRKADEAQIRKISDDVDKLTRDIAIFAGEAQSDEGGKIAARLLTMARQMKALLAKPVST